MSDTEIEIIETPLFLPDDDSEPEVDEISGQLLNETVYRVYREEWDNFFEWKRHYSAASISNLSRASYSRPVPLPSFEHHTWPQINVAEDDMVTWFEIEEANPNTTERTSIRVGVEPVIGAEREGYSRYTMCTPASRNLLGEEEEAVRAPFAPYADDKDFDLPRYLKKFPEFEWQHSMPDPEVEALHLDVSRRLHYRNGVTLEAIDNLGIFDETKLREKISAATKRDEIRWPGNQLTDLPKLENKQRADSLLNTVMKMNELFCANLNCLIPLCDLHDPHIITHFHPKPKITNEAYTTIPGKVCKRECYRSLGEENINMENNHWSDGDRELFKSVITMDPDASPCALAVICRKPCVEMYVARLNCIKDEDVQAAENDDGHVRFKEIDFVHDHGEKDKSVGPCSHVGPCNQYAIDCPCYANKQRCLRTCRCPITCNIRYEGCKCRPVKRHGIVEVCSNNCKCLELKRECDPEVCHATRHGRKVQRARTKKCTNMALQKGEHCPVYIKKSDYGLGAFALSNIRIGSCVGEYVGEILQEADKLGFRQTYAGLNYAFDYTGHSESGEILDSWNYGNEMRYLNHCGDDANCGAENVLVNGVLRIKIQAREDIRKGQELTLDYGDGYWSASKDATPSYREDPFDPTSIVCPGILPISRNETLYIP